MSFRSAGVIPAKLICSLKGAGLARVIGASAALANCCSAACAAGLTFDFSATFSITLGSILASFSAAFSCFSAAFSCFSIALSCLSSNSFSLFASC